MTHKRFHRARWISMIAIICVIGLRVLIVGGNQSGGSIAPIVAAIVQELQKSLIGNERLIS